MASNAEQTIRAGFAAWGRGDIEAISKPPDGTASASSGRSG